MKITAAAVALLCAATTVNARKVLPNFAQLEIDTTQDQVASTEPHKWYDGKFIDAEGNQVQFSVDVGSEAEHFYCSIWGYYDAKNNYHGDYVSCPYYNFA